MCLRKPVKKRRHEPRRPIDSSVTAQRRLCSSSRFPPTHQRSARARVLSFFLSTSFLTLHPWIHPPCINTANEPCKVMDPNWNDAVPSWRQQKTPQSASGRAATAASGKPRQWATIPCADEKLSPTTASSRTSSAMRSSVSTPGLATLGLGKFNIRALHEVNQQPDINHTLEECDDFFPGGLGIPDSFQGDGPSVLSDSTRKS